jgi:hypothetical protein
MGIQYEILSDWSGIVQRRCSLYNEIKHGSYSTKLRNEINIPSFTSLEILNSEVNNVLIQIMAVSNRNEIVLASLP